MINKLHMAMIELYHGDAKRIQHFCKVHSYAKLIAEMENVDAKTLFILETAALTHDIGIHLCEDFAFTFIRFTDFFVLPYHSVMSAYDYNTHVLSSFCSFRYINVGIGKYLSLA